MSKPREEPRQLGMRRIEVKQPAEQAYVAMAYRVPSIRNVQNLTAEDKDALALLVLSAVLDGYDGARLERALVQGKDRVADGASSSAGVMGRGPRCSSSRAFLRRARARPSWSRPCAPRCSALPGKG